MTNSTAEYHERDLRNVLSKLQKTGYCASGKKTELFSNELTWLGYHMNKNGVKPMNDKTEAITRSEAPKNVKELKSFLGSIQHLFKIIKNLSKKTDRMRRLFKKGIRWE